MLPELKLHCTTRSKSHFYNNILLYIYCVKPRVVVQTQTVNKFKYNVTIVLKLVSLVRILKCSAFVKLATHLNSRLIEPPWETIFWAANSLGVSPQCVRKVPSLKHRNGTKKPKQKKNGHQRWCWLFYCDNGIVKERCVERRRLRARCRGERDWALIQ